jgi:hypothetical protein
VNLEINLVPHTGTQIVENLGEVLVQFSQYIIVVTGEDYKKATGRESIEVGYVDKRPEVVDPRTGVVYKCPINWLPTARQWPESVLDKMAQSVQAELAELASASQKDKDLVAAGKTRPVQLPPPESTVTAPQSDADGSDENL